MLRELNTNEMDMVSGGQNAPAEDEVVSEGERYTPDAPASGTGTFILRGPAGSGTNRYFHNGQGYRTEAEWIAAQEQDGIMSEVVTVGTIAAGARVGGNIGARIGTVGGVLGQAAGAITGFAAGAFLSTPFPRAGVTGHPNNPNSYTHP